MPSVPGITQTTPSGSTSGVVGPNLQAEIATTAPAGGGSTTAPAAAGGATDSPTPSEAPNTPPTTKDGDDGLSTGAIVGIVLGSIAFVVFAGFTIMGLVGGGGGGGKEQEMTSV